jgi:hypothetical protein
MDKDSPHTCTACPVASSHPHVRDEATASENRDGEAEAVPATANVTIATAAIVANASARV